MAQREMYDGNGPGSKLVRKIAGITTLPGGDNTFSGTERNIIPERPFIDRSNPNQPKSQILGAVKDRISNFFQPSDPAYNYDSTDAAPAAAPTTAAAPLRKIADPLATSATSGLPALPGKIRNFSVNQTANGSGTLTPSSKAPRRNITAAPAPGVPAAAPIASIATPPESAGYGEYSGEEASRIAAGPAAQPALRSITSVSPPQTSTIGYGHGVYDLAAGQNAPPDFSNASLGDLATYKFGVNQQVKQAGIANVGSEINRRAAQTELEANMQPSEIKRNLATARVSNVNADLGIFKAPAEVENIKATTDHTKASTFDILEMMNPKKNAMLSDIKYKDGMLKIAGDRLGILKDQVAAHAAQQSKGDATDWAGISKSALEAIKLIDAKAALGGITPEDTQNRQNYVDTYNKAFPRQKRTAYQPAQQIASTGGE